MSALDVRSALRAEECPACEGRGGTQRDDWGYEIDPCPACGGSGLREARSAPRVRDHIEPVALIPHSGRHDRVALRAFLAELRAGRCEPTAARCVAGRDGRR